MQGTFTIGGVTFDKRLTTAIILTTLLALFDYYGRDLLANDAYNRFVVYFFVPLLVIVFVFRDKPAHYGLRIGPWREGLLWVVAVCAVMALILLTLAATPEMRAFYTSRAPDSVTGIIVENGFEMFGWEFVWRGFLLFTMAQTLGPGAAIWLQAVPFTFMHLGKPEAETLTTLFGGAGFGFIAWRTQSFYYGWLIHWFLGAFTMLVATGAI